MPTHSYKQLLSVSLYSFILQSHLFRMLKISINFNCFLLTNNLTNNNFADQAEFLQEVKVFSHNDLVLGHVFIEIPDTNMTNMTYLKDRIVMRLVYLKN